MHEPHRHARAVGRRATLAFTLTDGDIRTFGDFPAGTEWVVTETVIGGAISIALDPGDGTFDPTGIDVMNRSRGRLPTRSGR